MYFFKINIYILENYIWIAPNCSETIDKKSKEKYRTNKIPKNIRTYIFYKNIEFIKVTYVSFFVLISLMFKYYNVDMFYIIIALSVLVFFLNIFAYKNFK